MHLCNNKGRGENECLAILLLNICSHLESQIPIATTLFLSRWSRACWNDSSIKVSMSLDTFNDSATHEDHCSISVCFPWLDTLLSVLRIMFQPRFQVEGVSIESNGNNPNAHHQLRGILASLIVYWIISGHAIIWTNLEDVTESTKAVHEKTGWEMKLKPIRPFFLLNIQWEYWTRSLRVPPAYGGIQPWRCKVCDPFTRLLSSQWYHSVPMSWQKWSNLQTPGKTMPPTTPIHSSPTWVDGHHMASPDVVSVHGCDPRLIHILPSLLCNLSDSHPLWRTFLWLTCPFHTIFFYFFSFCLASFIS